MTVRGVGEVMICFDRGVVQTFCWEAEVTTHCMGGQGLM